MNQSNEVFIEIRCPKCKDKAYIRKKDFDYSPVVKCENCWHVYDSTNHRNWGKTFEEREES